MPVSEIKTLIKEMDGNGNLQIIYPITKKECINGLDNATQSANGLMSASDKTKLDGIETGANYYIHPTTAGNIHIPTGGAAGDVLIYGNNSGTAEWNGCLTDIVDNGFKNLIDFKHNGEVSYNQGWTFETPLNLTAGKYILSFKITSPNQIAAELAVDGSTITKYPSAGTDVYVFYNFTVNSSATRLRFWINGGPSSVNELMICTLDDWKISQKYAQYRPNLDKIIKAITPTTFNINANTNFAISSIDTYRCNGLAWFGMAVKSSSQIVANNSYSIGTIDTVAKGKGTTYLQFTATVDNSFAKVKCWLSTDGQTIGIGSDTDIPANTNIYITGMYHCAQ